MPIIVDNSIAYKAMENGFKIGEVPASKETKGSFSEVFCFENKFFSCVFDGYQDANFCVAEEILFSELKSYVVDIDESISIIKQNGIDINELKNS